MPCYKPLQAWREPGALNPGQPRIVFTKHNQQAKALTLPCGQCIGCRLEKSRQWAVRIMHEAQMHEKNCFLTLTYSDQQLPSDRSLHVEDYQLFMKRLRKGSSSPLRYFHCGEYGEETQRPHYHACIFGEDFSEDREVLFKTPRGDSVFISDRLSEVWGLGHATIGELTFESAAYVARYCLKKVTGEKAISHYGDRQKEYVTMSRRPGVGATWYDSFHSEVYPSDSVVMRGKEMMPPQFYDRLLEKADPELYEKVKKERRSEMKGTDQLAYFEWEEFYGSRVGVKEKVKSETLKHTLKRSI